MSEQLPPLQVGDKIWIESSWPEQRTVTSVASPSFLPGCVYVDGGPAGNLFIASGQICRSRAEMEQRMSDRIVEIQAWLIKSQAEAMKEGSR